MINMGGGAFRSTAIEQSNSVKKPHFKFKMKFKPTAATAYVAVFVLIVGIAFANTVQPKKIVVVSSDTNSSQLSNVIDQTSVDNAIATNIAANVAQVSNLPIANSVSSLAISIQLISSINQYDNTNPQKPQIIETVTDSRLVTNYIVQAGDTLDSLSSKFNVSSQTIKWANNISSSNLTVGSNLKILPVDGVLYNVKSGDTIESISKKYNVDATRIVTYNDLEISGLQPNSSIILPKGVLPDNERPGYVAPVTYSAYISMSPNNGYAYGNCTWYAYERRLAIGKPVSGNWGNANTWAIYASGGGYLVDRTPGVGAVLVDTSGYYGHVAVVESVLQNGDIVISEMNNYAYGGWNRVNNRTIPSSQVSLYRYIH